MKHACQRGRRCVDTGLYLSIGEKVGVYWYLLSNHCTQKGPMSTHKRDLHQGNVRQSRKSPMKPLHPFLASQLPLAGSRTPNLRLCMPFITFALNKPSGRAQSPSFMGGGDYGKCPARRWSLSVISVPTPHLLLFCIVPVSIASSHFDSTSDVFSRARALRFRF